MFALCRYQNELCPFVCICNHFAFVSTRSERHFEKSFLAVPLLISRFRPSSSQCELPICCQFVKQFHFNGDCNRFDLSFTRPSFDATITMKLVIRSLVRSTFCSCLTLDSSSTSQSFRYLFDFRLGHVSFTVRPLAFQKVHKRVGRW
jgi:hypothetical protein